MGKKILNNKKRKDLIFCLLVLLVPMVQFAIFYIGVNVNSFAMAFQEYVQDSETLRGSYKFRGFKDLFGNFKLMFEGIEADGGKFWLAVKNSFVAFFVTSLVSITLALIFSMYISKKMPASGFFRALLFAPSILSAAVTVVIFKSFVEAVVPEIFGIEGLLANAKTKFGTILFYNVWIGFGVQILMYSGAMSGIDPSITEAAKLDGASPFREFFSITLPLIYPTIQTFLITGVAGLFINQINLIAFEGLTAEPEYRTVGYYLFSQAESPNTTKQGFLILATYGVVLTLIAAPLTLGTRWALEKFGPSVE